MYNPTSMPEEYGEEEFKDDRCSDPTIAPDYDGQYGQKLEMITLFRPFL
jgi:hypothetical protein